MRLALLLLPLAASAAEDLEKSVKSTYLFKLADYVTWPDGAFATPEQPFVIGVLGDDPFGSALDEAVRGRTALGRPIVVRRVALAAEVSPSHVNVLFIAPSESARAGEIATALEGSGVLTVGESAARSGAAVEFVMVDGKVRFATDAQVARRQNVKLGSKLLSLAVARRW